MRQDETILYFLESLKPLWDLLTRRPSHALWFKHNYRRCVSQNNKTIKVNRKFFFGLVTMTTDAFCLPAYVKRISSWIKKNHLQSWFVAALGANFVTFQCRVFQWLHDKMRYELYSSQRGEMFNVNVDFRTFLSRKWGRGGTKNCMCVQKVESHLLVGLGTKVCSNKLLFSWF